MGIEKDRSEESWHGTTTLERVGLYSFLAVVLSSVIVYGAGVTLLLYFVPMFRVL